MSDAIILRRKGKGKTTYTWSRYNVNSVTTYIYDRYNCSITGYREQIVSTNVKFSLTFSYPSSSTGYVVTVYYSNYFKADYDYGGFILDVPEDASAFIRVRKTDIKKLEEYYRSYFANGNFGKGNSTISSVPLVYRYKDVITSCSFRWDVQSGNRMYDYMDCVATRYGLSPDYSIGTYVDQITTTSSGYPSNGRYSGDGYWYILISSNTSYSQGSTRYSDVTSESRNTYPDNDRSGSYWYVYQGESSSGSNHKRMLAI